MKLSIYTVLLAITIVFTQCCKEKPTNSNDNNIPGLPPATQSGANTLGFLLNGVPWTPAGNNGTANLSIDFDPGIDNGIFSLAAYRSRSNHVTEYFGIGLRDSVNLITTPVTFNISQQSLCGVFFSKDPCMYDYFSNEVYRKGQLTILKLDRANRVISGTFDFTVYRNGCDSIKITNGRFDMKI
jgi:hypothetical protein